MIKFLWFEGIEGILSEIRFCEKFDIFDKISNFVEINTVSYFTRFNSNLKYESRRINKMKIYWPKHVLLRWMPRPLFGSVDDMFGSCPDQSCVHSSGHRMSNRLSNFWFKRNCLNHDQRVINFEIPQTQFTLFYLF